MRFTFNNTFKILIENLGYKGYTAEESLANWRTFVSECEGGYNFDFFDYINERSIRTTIQEILDSNELMEFDDLMIFKKELNEIDFNFKRISNEYNIHGKYWWERSFPNYGSEEFVKSVIEFCGIDKIKLK